MLPDPAVEPRTRDSSQVERMAEGLTAHTLQQRLESIYGTQPTWSHQPGIPSPMSSHFTAPNLVHNETPYSRTYSGPSDTPIAPEYHALMRGTPWHSPTTYDPHVQTKANTTHTSGQVRTGGEYLMIPSWHPDRNNNDLSPFATEMVSPIGRDVTSTGLDHGIVSQLQSIHQTQELRSHQEAQMRGRQTARRDRPQPSTADFGR